MSLGLSPRDLEAYQAAVMAGDATVPTVDTTAELTPEQAVLQVLTYHLTQLEARLENEHGAPTALRFRRVSDDWPQGTDPTQYPSATVLSRTTNPRDAVLGTPVVQDNRDVISADDCWALWQLGEDTGEATVHVFASHRAHRNALRSAVEAALYGSLDRTQGAVLPLPELLLPPPFRGLVRRKTLITHTDTDREVDDALAGAGGIWRCDVHFKWQAPRFAARPRIPDLRPVLAATVEETP